MRVKQLMRNHSESATILDVGSRTEKIRSDALAVDINVRVKPNVCASIEYLPFRDKTFSCASYLEVIEHLDNSQLGNALREANRVARYLVLSTPNTSSRSWNWVWYFWSRSIGREWKGAHKSSFTPEQITSLLERHGFEIIATNFSRWSLLLEAKSEIKIRGSSTRRVSVEELDFRA